MDDILEVSIKKWLQQAIHEATKKSVEKCFPELSDTEKELLIFKHTLDMYVMLAPTLESTDTNESEEDK